MKSCIRRFAAILIAFALPNLARATDRIYRDRTVRSPSGRYQVDAVSPDNVDKTRYHPFQANFTYTCRDTATGAILWTRKQAMDEPAPLTEGSKNLFQFPIEPSPIGLFVSDDGWTVIYDGWHEFIVVDIKGQDRGKVKLLSEGFTPEERRRYVYWTTAGEMWDGPNDYFFRNVGKDSLFVTRPRWGRAVIINLGTGKLNDEKAASTKAIRAGDFNRAWDDPKVVTRAIAYGLALMLIPFLIVCGVWIQRRAARRRSKQQNPTV